ncbi:hypothetical protein EP227_06175 [bacterium]|nr:MAG: hypothetical protein EP227_06175 [bacterium]
MVAKKPLSVISILCAALLFSGFIVSSVYAEDTCIDCHKDSKFRVQNKMIYDYFNNWKDSTHDLAGVLCVDCHSGNATQKDKDKAHKDSFRALTVEDKASYKEIPKRCGKCHESVLKSFVDSKHYKALLEKEFGPHCSTCHGSVNVDVYYTSIVETTCIACHNEKTKIRPEIVVEAKTILQRINIARAYREWTSIYYAKSQPDKVREIDALYSEVANAWHNFNFAQLDQKSQKLLTELRAALKMALAEKKQKSEQ